MTIIAAAEDGESPIYVEAYDLLKWVVPSTAKFPKQQRFVLARRIEDAAFGFHRAIVRAGLDASAGLAAADIELTLLRASLRLACDLRYYSMNQYGPSGPMVPSSWRSRAASSHPPGGPTRRRAGLRARTMRGRATVLRGGSFNNNPIDQPANDDPQP